MIGRHLVAITAIVTLATPLFLIYAAHREVTSIVEERVAITAREMWRANDWVLPTMNGEPRLAKPPLCYWLPQAFATWRGVFDDFTLRAPYGIAAVLTIVATYGIGCLAGGWAVGCAAAVVLFSSPLFIKFGARATPDMVFLATVTGAWYFYALTCSLLEKRDRRASPGRSGSIRWSQRAFYVMLVLAGLAKGPILLVVVVLPIVVEAAVTRSRRPLAALWSPSGIALFVALSALWPALVFSRLSGGVESDGTVRDWFMQSLGKVLPRDELDDYLHHPEPWHYYLPRLGSALGMWVVTLPVVVWFVFRRRPLFPDGACPEGRDAWTPRIVSWFLAVLVVFSLIAEKKSPYILPLLPAGALLAGSVVVMAYDRWHRHCRLAATTIGIICALGAAASVVLVYSPELAQRTFTTFGAEPWTVAKLTEQSFSLVMLGAMLAAGFLALRSSVMSESPAATFGIIGATISAFLVVYNGLRISVIPPGELVRDETIAAARILPDDRDVVAFGLRIQDLPGGMLYYLDRRVRFVVRKDAERFALLPRDVTILTSAANLNGLGAGVPEALDNAALDVEALRLAGVTRDFELTRVINPREERPILRVVVLEPRP